jgi:CRP-like cAMP-binding protein
MQDDTGLLLKKSFSKFCELDNNTWKVIQDLFVHQTLVKDEIFTKEGELSRKFGFVCSGYLQMFNQLESGKELTKHFLQSGDFFVGSVNLNEINLVSIKTITECKIMVADYKALEELVCVNKQVLQFKTNLISNYIQIKQNRENNYLNLDSHKRYELFLKEFPNLINHIPHYYVASYLGVSSTQLSRIRRKILIG